MCTNVLKTIVSYYVSHGSHVFTCFIVFSKAFDEVNYWKLLMNLLDDDVDVSTVRLLSLWFSHQDVLVRYRSVLSDSFKKHNGTRQGSLLSPFVFARYVRSLLHKQCIILV